MMSITFSASVYLEKRILNIDYTELEKETKMN